MATIYVKEILPLFLLAFCSVSPRVDGHPQSTSKPIESPTRSDEYIRSSPLDLWATESSHVFHAVLPPQTVVEKNRRHKSNFKSSTKFRLDDFSGNNLGSGSTFLPLLHLNETGGDRIPKMDSSRNSRFFSLDTSAQSLNLGVSFTVPFISIPTKSLLTLGQTATSALSELLNFNFPSIAMAVVIIGVVMFFVPKVMNVILSFLTQYGIPGSFKFSGEEINFGDNLSSYSNIVRSMEVAPFTSILNQIDKAMREYNLDSTSCMQRLVCTYVSETENAISRGRATSNHLIFKGLVGSPWVHKLLGNNALTEALQSGSSASDSSLCSRKFPKCPFSLPGIVKFLASYTSSKR